MSDCKYQPVKTIAISSGKGGVGKSNIAVNLAIALSHQGKRVGLFDADLGLANIDILLGIHPIRNLTHVINGQCGIKDIMVSGPEHIQIIPAASGVRMLENLNPQQHMALIHAMEVLAGDIDVLLIDTSAGISDSVLNFCAASQHVIVTVCNEPTSLADAYALMKILYQDYHVTRFQVVVNKVPTVAEGKLLYRHLFKVTTRFLDIVPELVAVIPEDEYVIKAVKKQTPVLQSYPHATASRALKKLAENADTWKASSVATGLVEFFSSYRVQTEASVRLSGSQYE